MNQNYTHMSVILDRTGSMESIRDDVIGGFNAFLHDQQQQEGKATLTLVQFDTQDPYEVVHHWKDIKAVPDLDRNTYVPRASTPLYDAIGRGIIDLEASIAKLPESDRPSQVMMVIITDGQENSSREFTKARVTQMIKEKQEKQNWQFVFLSADLEAMNDARGMGFADSASLLFAKTSAGSAEAFQLLSQKTVEYRFHKKKKFGFDLDDHQKDDSSKEQS
jgi:Mg-chelatase subunit ChlD